MVHLEVKKAMLDRGISLKRLAEITGYSKFHLCGVINGRIESERAKKVISLALNRKFNELWNR